MKTFKIIGRKYGNKKFYHEWDDKKEFHYYKKTDEKELGIFKFKNLLDAEIFLVANFPEWIFGANIIQVDNEKGGDFSMFAIPEYCERIYNTTDRKLIMEKELERLLKRES